MKIEELTEEMQKKYGFIDDEEKKTKAKRMRFSVSQITAPPQKGRPIVLVGVNGSGTTFEVYDKEKYSKSYEKEKVNCNMFGPPIESFDDLKGKYNGDIFYAKDTVKV